MATKRQLSPAQLNQRRANGQALAARVDRDYYKFIGRRGGRRFMYNVLMGLATTWTPPAEVAARGASPAHTERLIEAERARWREEAEEKYQDEGRGTRMMIALFEKGQK